MPDPRPQLPFPVSPERRAQVMAYVADHDQELFALADDTDFTLVEYTWALTPGRRLDSAHNFALFLDAARAAPQVR